MKVINIPIDDEDYDEIIKVKDELKYNWREFLIKAAEKFKKEKHG